MSQDIIVVGHKNPDTDSVCSAIAYANLKNLTSSKKHVAYRAGNLNAETRYVLSRFNMEIPPEIENVGAQVQDTDYRRTEGISSHISLKKAWELMRTMDVVTLPLVTPEGFLEGVIVNGDIAYSYMDVYDNRVLSRARTQFSNIIDTLNGTMIIGNEHAYFTRGKVLVATGNRETLRAEIEVDDLVILGNLKERQLIAIEEGAGCIVVCSMSSVDREVMKAAEENQCIIIATEYDTFTAARLIHQSMPVKYFMTKGNIVNFEPDDYLEDVREVMGKIRHRDFPILNEQRQYVGMISRRNLMSPRKKQIILVDHNEKSQTVDGIDQADLLEIIDHHRLGSLETLSPIYFRNQPLGSTATIITLMYEEKGIELDPEMAGILCSAIVSDTLMFRSPTCTPQDEKIARRLAKIAGVEIDELAIAMFEAGSDFSSKTTEELYYQDFKIFDTEGVVFGVSQISAVSRRQLDSIKEQLKSYMPKVIETKNLDMAFVMLTDIFNEETEVLFLGDNSEGIILKAFGFEKPKEKYMLHNVVSRKKQFIPAVMEAFQPEDKA